MVARYGNLVNKWLVLGLVLTAVLGTVLALSLSALAQEGNDAIELTHDENDDGPVGYFTAADPEGDTARWSEMTLGGTDADRFDFEDGVLTFKTAPNFERPMDIAGAGDGTPTSDSRGR